MCNFPNDIKYDPNFAGLGKQKIPQSTYTYLKKNNIADDHLLDGIPDMDNLEKFIIEKIKDYNGNDEKSLYDIFCLIHIWGGNWGKVVFWSNLPFKESWEKFIKEQYRLLVKMCLSVRPDKNAPLNICKTDIDSIFNAVQTIKDNVPGLGISFITKHTRFWLQRNNEKNPLPIFDNIMANGLLNRAADITLLNRYWNCMIEKAISLNNDISLLALERQLFNYFREQRQINDDTIPTRWRNDLIDEGEWIQLNGFPVLLFVGHDYLGRYYCELNFMEDIGIDIRPLLDTVFDGSSISLLSWKSRNPQYRYVMFGEGETNKVNAQTLKQEISEFVCRYNKKNTIQ